MIKISRIVPTRFFVPSIVFMCSLFSLSLSATRASLEEDIRKLFAEGKYTIQDREFTDVEIIFVNPRCWETSFSEFPCDGQKSWTRGFKTIREAVAKAKTLKGRLGVILVKEGIYTKYGAQPRNIPVLKLDGNPNLVIIGGFVGSKTASGFARGDLSDKRSTLHGLWSSNGVIFADFPRSQARHYVEIRNFDIKKGCANLSGKINCTLSTMWFRTDETLREISGLTKAGDNGGGLKVLAQEGSRLRFSVRDSKFAKNRASSRGGAMFFSLPSQYARVTIVDSEFEGNRAGLGGAFFGNIARYDFEGNTFHNNEGTFGGGAYFAVETETNFGANNDFVANLTQGNGGAIFDRRTRGFEINSPVREGGVGEAGRTSIYSGNEASGPDSRGGAIYVDNANGPVVITGPKIFKNKAAMGGGIAILGGRQEEQEETAAAAPAAPMGPIRLSNIWIANNEARFAGGGVYFKNVAGEPLIIGVEFFLNRVVTNDLHRAIINDLMQGLTLRADQEALLRDPAGEGGKGGGLYTTRTTVRILNSTFIRNGAGHGGGAHVEEGNAIFENLEFRQNQAFRWGGAIKLFERTKSIFREKLYVLRNTSLNGTGGIHARASELVFEGQATIDDNMAQKQAGGGITLNKGSKLIVSSGATLTLTKNVSGAEAPDGGAGAIFAADRDSSVIGSIGGISCDGNTPPGTEGLAEKVASCEN